jgi:hypothetical protein
VHVLFSSDDTSSSLSYLRTRIKLREVTLSRRVYSNTRCEMY